MIPGRCVVTGPCGRIPLSPDICRPCKHKWSQIGLEAQQSFVGGAGIFHAEHVVDFAVRCRTARLPGFINAMQDFERHGAAWNFKDRWLVHVIPKPGDATVYVEIFVKIPPPFPSRLSREVRKDARSRPHLSHVNTAVGIVHEVISRHSCVVGRVVFARQVCDMKISNGDYVDSLLVQIADHLIKGWELCRIDRERTVLNLIIDIEINDIDGNLLLPEGICNLPHTRLSFVTVARLLKSKSPLRWKGLPSYKLIHVHH